jgi:DHA2 family methylenomycin A resistance protein-like MFS transporter
MLTGPRQRAILGYVLGSASYVLEIALTPLILPVLRTSFGLSLAEVTFVTNGYALAVVLSVLTAGWLGDRVGPKRVFLAGAVLYAGASLLVALAGGLEALLAFRLLQGLGAGLFSAMIPVLLARAGGDRPGRLLALWYSSSGFVVASAPLLAAPLVASFGWRAVYVAVAIVALPACALALRSRDAPAAIRAPGGGRLRDLARDPRCAVLCGSACKIDPHLGVIGVQK